MQRRPEAGATKLPPLDVCLSAMDERIEYLSSALSSLSEELGGKRASLVSNGGGGGGGGAELAAVKLKLAEAEAKVAAGGGGGGGPELAALKAENADLKLQVKEKDEVIASLSDELDSTAAAAFAASASLGAPPQMPACGLQNRRWQNSRPNQNSFAERFRCVHCDPPFRALNVLSV